MDNLLDTQLEFYSKFILLFKVEKFFKEKEKLGKILGVPFHIRAKNINMNCEYARQKHLERERYLYCVNPEHLEIYGRSGSKILSCQNCPLNNK